MARIRSIKPQHCSDRELPNISFGAHLLWVLNWCFSDDLGVFEDDPLLIKSNIFPRRKDVKEAHITYWLKSLCDFHFIIPFEYNGSKYYVNRTFSRHQKIDKPQPSPIPKDFIRGIIEEYSKKIPSLIGEDRIRKGEEEDRRRSGRPLKTEKLFRDSEFFDFEKFKEKLENTEYKIFNLKFYYESVLNWSDGKSAEKKDWIATAKNFMLKDSQAGKAVLATDNLLDNGKSTTKSNIQQHNERVAAELEARFS